MRKVAGPRRAAPLALVFVGLLGIAGLFAIDPPFLRLAPMTASEVERSSVGGDFRIFWATGYFAAQGTPERAQDRASMMSLAPLRQQPVGGWLTPYPPTWLLVVGPLGALPFPWAWTVYLWSSVCLLLAGVAAAFRPQMRVALPLTLGFCGVWVAAGFGQNTLAFAGLVLLGLAALPRHSLLAGLLLGLATLKPHLSILFPLVLIATKQVRALVGVVLGALGLVALSLVCFGPTVWTDYLHNATRPLDRLLAFSTMRPELMISTYAGLRLAGLDAASALVGQALVAAGAVFVLLGIVRRSIGSAGGWSSGGAGLALASAVVATLLSIPHAYSYDLVLLILPILVLLDRAQRVGWHAQDVEVTALAYVLPILVVPSNVWSHAPVIPLALLVILQRLDHHSRADEPNAAPISG